MGLCGNIIIDYCELVMAASCGHRRQHALHSPHLGLSGT